MRTTRTKTSRTGSTTALVIGLVLVVLVSLGVLGEEWLPNSAPPTGDYDYELRFPADRYPETGAHIAAAVERGRSQVCTIDREGADRNRDLSLRGIPTRPGYDRDEWPMAMCAEGGDQASVAYITPSDNRGAGSWVSNQLSDYPDGTVVLFVIEGDVDMDGVDFATD